MNSDVNILRMGTSKPMTVAYKFYVLGQCYEPGVTRKILE